MTKSYIIAIWGPSGSGKSTLINYLKKHLSALYLNEDDYFIPPPQNEDILHHCFDSPSALRLDTLHKNLQELTAMRPIQLTPYDLLTRTLGNTVALQPQPLIIIEGRLFATLAKIRPMISLSIYLDTPIDTCMDLRAKRDASSRKRNADEIHQRIQQSVIPRTQQFIEPYRHLADHRINPHHQDAYQSILHLCQENHLRSLL
ncbi:MAG: uridine kinase family protein [Candidatus Comchoanobacterales bacterium]